MGSQYDEVARGRALAALGASAARSPDKVPNYTRISRETGITRQTLRVWWRAHGGVDEEPAEPIALHVAAPPRESEGESHEEQAATSWAMDQLGISNPDDHRVQLVMEARRTYITVSSDTARVAAAKLMVEKVIDLRPVDQIGGVLTPAEQIEQMCSMPELLIQALLQSPKLWGDPRVRAALGT